MNDDPPTQPITPRAKRKPGRKPMPTAMRKRFLGARISPLADEVLRGMVEEQQKSAGKVLSELLENQIVAP